MEKKTVINKDGKMAAIKEGNEIDKETTVHNAPIKVIFKESANQTGGFDDNNIEEYPHYEEKFGRPVVWKSLYKDSPSKITAVIDSLPKKIYFQKDKDITFLTPTNAITKRQEITLSSGYEGEMTVNVRRDSITGDSIALFKTIAYEKIKMSLGIIYIDEENDDIQEVEYMNETIDSNTVVVSWGENTFLDTKPNGDDQEIKLSDGKTVIIAGMNKRCDTRAENTNKKTTNLIGNLSGIKEKLNEIYNSANVRFTNVAVVGRIAINYDLNRDQKIKTSALREEDLNWFEEEYNSEYRAVKEGYLKLIQEKGDLYHYYCIVMNDSSTSNLYGMGGLNINIPNIFRYVLIISNHHNTEKTLYNTIGHELGHAAFDLEHPFDERGIKEKGYEKFKDPDNFMDYKDGFKSRKYQWEQIHSNDKYKIDLENKK